MALRDKILTMEILPEWRESARRRGEKVVVTNGCFDLLHAGHVTYLEAARAEGDVLLVGLNGDASVRELKGPGRPINSEEDRAKVLAALEAVGAVCIFPERRATRFLEVSRPDVYVKGGDFAVADLPVEEREVAARIGARVITLGHVPGRSTTELVEKLRRGT